VCGPVVCVVSAENTCVDLWIASSNTLRGIRNGGIFLPWGMSKSPPRALASMPNSGESELA
jgi:hypothetical protein